MNGLEAVEMRLLSCKDVIDFRFDANTYNKEYLLTEKLLNTQHSKSIQLLSKSVQNFGAYSLCSDINFVEVGIPFLMSENIRNNYIDYNTKKFVDDVSHQLLYKSHCSKNQVLITMAGEYLGRTAVYDLDSICSSNQAIAKITLLEEINPYLVSTFLNSRHGQNQINRLKTITGQPNINMSLIKSLLIPQFGDVLIGIIANTVKLAHKQLEQSQQLYQQAEELLMQELGLKNVNFSNNNTSIRKLSDSFNVTGRLDAEYYQPKYDEIIAKIKSYKYSADTIKAICEIKDKNYKLDDDNLYQYIELSNIGENGTISHCTLDRGRDLPSRAKLKVNTNDIIISSIEGSLNSCALVTQQYNNAICSTGFCIVRSNVINSAALLVLFKSFIVQSILKQSCSGTILTAINVDALKSIVIPIIDIRIQQQIEQKIQQSFALREQSQKLLTVAKQAVEIAIENDETDAIKFIKHTCSPEFVI